jgi:hypothetical protein
MERAARGACAERGGAPPWARCIGARSRSGSCPGQCGSGPCSQISARPAKRWARGLPSCSRAPCLTRPHLSLVELRHFGPDRVQIPADGVGKEPGGGCQAERRPAHGHALRSITRVHRVMDAVGTAISKHGALRCVSTPCVGQPPGATVLTCQRQLSPQRVNVAAIERDESKVGAGAALPRQSERRAVINSDSLDRARRVCPVAAHTRSVCCCAPQAR